MSNAMVHVQRQKSKAITLVAAIALGGPIAFLPSSAEAVPSLPKASVTADPSADAAAEAAATGRTVEVDAARTEYSQTFANPDGTFRLDTATGPQRVKGDDGVWHEPDSTVIHRADGTIGPRYAVVKVNFSKGGSSPLASITRQANTVAVGWPQSLPEPVLDADSVIYPEIYPGVDLRLTATPEGFRQVLIVKSATAATNPALKSVRFNVDSNALKAVPTVGGGLKFINQDGQAVFATPAGQMWDSSAGSKAPTATVATSSKTAKAPTMMSAADAPVTTSNDGATTDEADTPDGGDQVATLPVQVTEDTFSVAPKSTLLTDSSTAYPVFIDPSMGVNVSERTMLASAGFKEYNYTGDEGVGYCSSWGGVYCGTGFTKRLFYEFSPTTLKGKYIIAATFKAYQVHAFQCSYNRNINLYRTSSEISSGTNWPGPTASTFLDSNNSLAGCGGSNPAAWVEFSGSAVTSAVRSFADGAWPRLTLRLSASSESDTSYWKRFRYDSVLSVSTSRSRAHPRHSASRPPRVRPLPAPRAPRRRPWWAPRPRTCGQPSRHRSSPVVRTTSDRSERSSMFRNRAEPRGSRRQPSINPPAGGRATALPKRAPR